MKIKRAICWFVAVMSVCFAMLGWAQSTQRRGMDPGLGNWNFVIEGVPREALVYIPREAKLAKTAVVFVFHGHGGTARHAARTFGIHRRWPEAVSVYMQGLNTPGRLTDPEGKKPGWQVTVGDQGDRDLKFFDAVLARLKKDYQIDTTRIYSTGHSNGGMFTYLLWEARHEVLHAVAPSGAATGIRGSVKLQPKPAMHLAGEKDRLVKFEWQKLTMNLVRTVNQCDREGKPWGRNCTIYESKGGTPLITFIHPGGHEFPAAGPSQIVKFFKRYAGESR